MVGAIKYLNEALVKIEEKIIANNERIFSEDVAMNSYLQGKHEAYLETMKIIKQIRGW